MSRFTELLESLTDPTARANISQDILTEIKTSIRTNQNHYPYHVPKAPAEILQHLGIPTNPFATQLHQHAAEKHIENRMLQLAATHLTNHAGPKTLIQFKPSKLRYLNRGPGNGDQIINYTTEPKDFLRFGEGSPELATAFHQPIHNREALLHDTLHFMTPDQVVSLFSSQPTLRSLLATVTLPVEALHRHATLYPDLYTIDYFRSGFAYLPAGHGGAGYYHHNSTLQWLSIGTIITPELTLVMQKLETVGAHHLFIIRRYDTQVPAQALPAKHLYQATDLVTLHQIFYPRGTNTQRPYSVVLLNKLLLYAWSVKAVSMRDLFAKVRQLMNAEQLGNSCMGDLLTLVNYLLIAVALNNVADYPTLLCHGLFRRLSTKVQTSIRALLEPLTGRTQYQELQKIVRWEKFHYHLTPRTIRNNTRAKWVDLEPAEDLDQLTLDDCRIATAPIHRVGIEKRMAQLGLDHVELPTDEAAQVEEATLTSDALNESAPLTPAEDATTASATAEHPELPEEDRDTLAKLGFTEFRPQTGPWGIIKPVLHNPTPIGDDTKPPLIPTLLEIRDTILSGAWRTVDYRFDTKRAGPFASDTKNKKLGALLPSQPNAWLQSFDGRCEQGHHAAVVTMVLGAGGCGKSYALQRSINANREAHEDIVIITPTVALRNDWQGKVPAMRSSHFKTYEKAMVTEAAALVIFDDFGKLPPGYIDAYLIMHPDVQWAVLTGCFKQSSYHVENREAYTSQLPTEMTHFRQYGGQYINATHRQPARFANPLDVHAERLQGGAVSVTTLTPQNGHILVPSRQKQVTLSEMQRDCSTYSGCQGLTKSSVVILLDDHTPMCSTEVLYTALSRATAEVIFINTHPDNQAFQDKLDAAPYLRTFLTGVREDEQVGREPELPDDQPTEPEVTKTHLPVENTDAYFTTKQEETVAPEERELFSTEHGRSNLAQTEDHFVQMFPHQQAKDKTLEDATFKSRLRFASATTNAQALLKSRDLGDLLFEAYADFMHVPKEPVPFDWDLWRTCVAKAERNYLSKTATQLSNGSKRQDPDFDDFKIDLFVKSQWVKKIEKVGEALKPGQTISSFKQTTVLLTAAFALYMRRQREATQPNNVFIMCERTPRDFNDFVLGRGPKDGGVAPAPWNFNRDAYTNDYTEYDQSQDGPFLNFELRKARHYNVPAAITDFYRATKLNSRVLGKTLAIMRLSGEGPTYDANTECGIAYDALKHELNIGVKAAYAGDDCARDKVAPVRSSWAQIEDGFILKAKPVVTRRSTFCGWLITRKGVVKDPVQLHQSLKLGLQLGKLNELIPSYSLDFAHAYALGDEVFEIFDENDMAHHQATVRLMHKLGVHPKFPGNHMPTYHITSDRLLSVRGTTPRRNDVRPLSAAPVVTVGARSGPIVRATPTTAGVTAGDAAAGLRYVLTGVENHAPTPRPRWRLF